MTYYLITKERDDFIESKLQRLEELGHKVEVIITKENESEVITDREKVHVIGAPQTYISWNNFMHCNFFL